MGRFQNATVVGSARGGRFGASPARNSSRACATSRSGSQRSGWRLANASRSSPRAGPSGFPSILRSWPRERFRFLIYPTLAAAQVRYILAGLRCRNCRRIHAAPAREDSGDPTSAAGAAGDRRDGRHRGGQHPVGPVACRRRPSAATREWSVSGASRNSSAMSRARSARTSSRRSSTHPARRANRRA